MIEGRGREETKRKIKRMKKEMEEMKKKEGVLHRSAPSNTPPITPIDFRVIASLDGTSFIHTE